MKCASHSSPCHVVGNVRTPPRLVPKLFSPFFVGCACVVLLHQVAQDDARAQPAAIRRIAAFWARHSVTGH